MPRPRFDKLDPDKQRRIFDAALTEFAAHGFEQASYNRIIETAGISKGAMYYYFEDKADLFITLLEFVAADKFAFLAELELNPDDPDPFWDAVRRASRGMVDLAIAQPELYRLGRLFTDLNPAVLGRRGEELMAAAGAMTADLLARGQAVGAVRTDLDITLLGSLAVAVDMTLDRWWAASHTELDHDSIEPFLELWIALMRRLLEPRDDALLRT